MPANAQLNIASSEDTATWQRQLDRDRLMASRKVQSGKIQGLGGTMAMPATFNRPQAGGDKEDSPLNTAKIGAAAARGAVTGGAAGAAVGAGVETAKQALANPEGTAKAAVNLVKKRLALIAMVVVIWAAIGLFAIVILVILACPFMSECPLSTSDYLGVVFDYVF